MIRIITDSTSNISQNDAKKLGIDVVPLYLHVNDKTYVDGVDLEYDEFYEILKTSSPTTSQPSPSDFLEVFKKYENDDIICITVSKKLSGTYQSAVLASQMIENKNIKIIDSTCASIAMRQIIEQALKLINEGSTFNEVIEKIEVLKNKINVLGMVDTLDNLKRSGRISNTKFVISNLINIKPIFILKDGVLEKYASARGKNKAILILKNSIESLEYDNNYPIYLGYSNNDENAKLLAKSLLTEDIKINENEIFEMGTVISTNTGENSLIISFFSK